MLHKFGAIGSEFIGEVVNILDECYGHLQPHIVKIVDFYVFKESSTMTAFINDEKKSLGIESSPFEETFFAIHDAWHGTPRIMIAHNRIAALPKLVSVGGIRHEVAHTVLHGSPEYYIFSIPSILRKIGETPSQYLKDILYLISIAVKDYEVTRLLYEKGYVEDQVAYCKFFLEPSSDELQAWTIAQTNRIAKIVAIASIFKMLCCATSLLKDEKYGYEILESIDKYVDYLPSTLSSRILKSLDKLTLLNIDTHRNVELFAKTFVETININII